MSCEHIKQLMTDKLAGELSQAKEQFLQNHLDSCESCKQEFDSLTNVWNVTKVTLKADAFIENLSDYQHQELKDAAQQERPHKTTEEQISEQKEKQKDRFPWYIKFTWTELAAGFVIFLIFGLLLVPRLGLFKSSKYDDIESFAELEEKAIASTKKAKAMETAQRSLGNGNMLSRLKARGEFDEELGEEEIQVDIISQKQLAAKEQVVVKGKQKTDYSPPAPAIKAEKTAVDVVQLKDDLKPIAASKALSPEQQKLKKIYSVLQTYAQKHHQKFPQKDGVDGLKELTQLDPSLNQLLLPKQIEKKAKKRMKSEQSSKLITEYCYIGGCSNASGIPATPVLYSNPEKIKDHGYILFSDGNIKSIPAKDYLTELKKLGLCK